MDVLAFALQVIYFLPMALRILTREKPESTVLDELAGSFKIPGLFLHEIGLLLVWTGFGVRFWMGGIERSVTWPGVVGNAILGVGTVLMFWSFATLRSWRLLPTIESGHELCTAGPYRFVRHPIYLAFDLLGVGVAIVVPDPVVIVGAVLLVLAGEMRARVEETALAGAFGDRYRSYMARVARTIPGVY